MEDHQRSKVLLAVCRLLKDRYFAQYFSEVFFSRLKGTVAYCVSIPSGVLSGAVQTAEFGDAP